MLADVPDRWFAGCDFTTDWSSRAFGHWMRHLGRLQDEPINILEVGAWEGRGSLFFLNFFRQSTLTAIDIFTLGNEGRFDRNVMGKFASRATKVKGSSAVELDRLAGEGQEFDLIYLDGSHLRDDVMIDSILAWRVLKIGGYLIWDDYGLIEAMPGYFEFPDEDPKPAIDRFLDWHGAELEVLHQEYQVIVRKTAAHYVLGRTGWDAMMEQPLPSIAGEYAEWEDEQQQRIARLEEHVQWLTKLHQTVAAHFKRRGSLSLSSWRSREQDILQRAGLFDANAYLKRYPDVSEAGMDPLYHYLRFGFAEGRSRRPE
jgi:cephalosporin hydroxylase